MDRSDLVAIATPASKTVDTDEKSCLPNISWAGRDGESREVEAIGVVTAFKVSAILKGDKSI